MRKSEHLISKNKVGFLEEYLYYGVYVHVTVILFFNQRFHTIFIAKLKKNKWFKTYFCIAEDGGPCCFKNYSETIVMLGPNNLFKHLWLGNSSKRGTMWINVVFIIMCQVQIGLKMFRKSLHPSFQWLCQIKCYVHTM